MNITDHEVEILAVVVGIVTFLGILGESGGCNSKAFASMIFCATTILWSTPIIKYAIDELEKARNGKVA